MVDHTPYIVGDTDWGHRGRAYAMGYIKALIDTVNAVSGSRKTNERSPCPKSASIDQLVEKLSDIERAISNKLKAGMAVSRDLFADILRWITRLCMASG